MIYFLVNNDYQLLDAQLHAEQLSAQGMSCQLIRIPHALKLPAKIGVFKQELLIPTPIKGRGWLSAWWRYFLVPRQLEHLLQPSGDDTLIIYTEFELLNHFLINQFKAVGGRVLHMEDGGVATYIPFAPGPAEPLTRKERAIARMTRMLPGLSDTVFHKMNGVVFPWRPDRSIDALCVYRRIAISRQIPVQLIQSPSPPPLDIRCGRVLFLNEPIYDHYQDETYYMAGLDRILQGLREGYSEVLFKFHPRETPAWRSRIGTLIEERHQGVQVLQEHAPMETLLERYAPEAMASYFSAILLNLQGTGIQPLYLYQLLGDLGSQPIFQQLTNLLRQWDYHFAASWAEVCSGYDSQLSFHGGVDARPLAALLSVPKRKT